MLILNVGDFITQNVPEVEPEVLRSLPDLEKEWVQILRSVPLGPRSVPLDPGMYSWVQGV